MTTLEQDQSGDASDLVATGDGGVLLSVQFCKAYPRFEFGRGLGKSGSHVLARTAPGGPKINQYRKVTALDVQVKGACRQRQGLACKQRLVAAAAVGLLVLLGGLHAVGFMTMGADDMQGSSHGATLYAK